MSRAPALPEPFSWREGQIAGALPGAELLFTTRNGGASEGAYASLNLGRLTDDADDPVHENRRRVAALAGQPWERFCFGRQVHGADVRRAAEPPSAARPLAQEDGQASTLADAALLVFTADCLPLVIATPDAVAVLHAGWKPLAAGIVAEGVSALRELGAKGELHAAIGPGARGCCYEVGDDVLAAFADHPHARHGSNLDLATVAREQLEAHGATVHDVGLCTICHPDLFFSHRRDQGVTGRQAGVAWRVAA